MATASTNTTLSNASNAAFQAWVNEVYTALVTNCGLTQTADTGQMAVPCTTAVPAANTIAGYYMFAFNDPLQATAPCFFKLEFGLNTNSGAGFIITMGTSTSGTGTVTGTVGTRVAVASGATIAGAGVTNYVSRYMYNNVYGACGMSFKIGSQSGGSANAAMGGFYFMRSVNNAGAATGTSMMLFTSSTSITYGGSSNPTLQGISYVPSATAFGPINPSYVTWTGGFSVPALAPSQTVTGTTGQVFPIFQYAPTATTPPYGITNQAAMGCIGEWPLGTSGPITILGSTSLTYMSVGNFTGGPQYSSITPNSSYSFLMLWQ